MNEDENMGGGFGQSVPDKGQTLDEAINEHVGNEGSIMTCFVLITEFMDSNGTQTSEVLFRDGMTIFQIKGMLHEALFGELSKDMYPDEEEGDEE